jgi:cell division protein FtsL
MVRKKYSRKQIALAIFGSFMTILTLTFYLWHLNENIRLGLETSKREDEFKILREDVKKLEAQRAGLLSLERVEKIAKEDLKLAEPKEDQVIYEDY